jgi:hypothetical protein
VGRSHGLRGAMRIQPSDDDAVAALEVATVLWIAGLGEARLLSFARHGRDWLARVDRVRDVEAAKRLVHAEVHAPTVGRDAGEVEGDDGPVAGRVRVGLPVTVDGRRWGEVVALEGSEMSPLARVRGPRGETWLPLAAPYVRVEANALRIDEPPEGLLEPS